MYYIHDKIKIETLTIFSTSLLAVLKRWHKGVGIKWVWAIFAKSPKTELKLKLCEIVVFKSSLYFLNFLFSLNWNSLHGLKIWPFARGLNKLVVRSQFYSFKLKFSLLI